MLAIRIFSVNCVLVGKSDRKSGATERYPDGSSDIDVPDSSAMDYRSNDQNGLLRSVMVGRPFQLKLRL